MDAGLEQAPAPAPSAERPRPQKSLLRDYMETILICVIFVIFSRAFVFQQSKIPSGSMRDTLLEGDYIMVNRFVFAQPSFELERRILPVRELRRGDVVVFRQPQEPEMDYIKRLIGVPGDMIKIQRGYVYVNGRRLKEPYVSQDNRDGANYGPLTVAPDHYFVLGDNRDDSYDSRAWGQVHRNLIKGRALLIWYSFPDSSESTSVGNRMKSWLEKALYFIPRSRWSRCFSLIR
jgi:signal peptidase I